MSEDIRVPGTNDEAILAQIKRGPQTLKGVAKGLRIDDGALHLRLHQMTALGWLEWDGSLFTITDEGRARL